MRNAGEVSVPPHVVAGVVGINQPVAQKACDLLLIGVRAMPGAVGEGLASGRPWRKTGPIEAGEDLLIAAHAGRRRGLHRLGQRVLRARQQQKIATFANGRDDLAQNRSAPQQQIVIADPIDRAQFFSIRSLRTPATFRPVTGASANMGRSLRSAMTLVAGENSAGLPGSALITTAVSFPSRTGVLTLPP